jgi:tryptophan 2,3-dioxygenase
LLSCYKTPRSDGLPRPEHANNPVVSNIYERLVDIDEGFQEWRYRHVKMVERTIGMKSGTGGSSGAGYLASTIKPFFADLWEIRSQLCRVHAS